MEKVYGVLIYEMSRYLDISSVAVLELLSKTIQSKLNASKSCL